MTGEDSDSYPEDHLICLFKFVVFVGIGRERFIYPIILLSFRRAEDVCIRLSGFCCAWCKNLLLTILASG